ncbi:MAG: acyltransferase family protein [Planctomycetota bacterium]
MSTMTDETIEMKSTNVPVAHGTELLAEVTAQRRHDLDALRAVAMLLGIVLHAALAFAPIPWTVSDASQSVVYLVLFSAIHGFRMPLFFLISGFFTAMLWRKRGLGGLIQQRLKRILVPLIIGCMTIVPAMWAVSILASQPSGPSKPTEIFDATAAGKTDFVRQAIESNTISIDAKHPASGSSLLTIATFYGQTETVEMLLNKGADVNQKNADAGTALHVAVFMGRAESAKRLLAAGANREAKDVNGNTPIDNLTVDFGTTDFIAKMYSVTLDKEELTQGRTEIAKLLGENESAAGNAVTAGPGIGALYGLFFQFPVFMHLWFLAFLCWLVIAFAAYTLMARRIPFSGLPKWLFCSPISLVWLVPLTMLPLSFMPAEGFGPATSVGLLPIPSVLAFYGIFFFFGVIYWDLDDQPGMLGRWWYITLPVALFIVFPLGLEIVSGTFGILPEEMAEPTKLWMGYGIQALFVWLMIFGSIGAFRALLWRESKTMRYISDSSYWLYLAHLPLVILAQWFVKDLPVPSFIKFIGIILVVSAVLLLTYDWFIRYTFIGTILNGPKRRQSKSLAVEPTS